MTSSLTMASQSWKRLSRERCSNKEMVQKMQMGECTFCLMMDMKSSAPKVRVMKVERGDLTTWRGRTIGVPVLTLCFPCLSRLILCIQRVDSAWINGGTEPRGRAGNDKD